MIKKKIKKISDAEWFAWSFIGLTALTLVIWEAFTFLILMFQYPPPEILFSVAEIKVPKIFFGLLIANTIAYRKTKTYAGKNNPVGWMFSWIRI